MWFARAALLARVVARSHFITICYSIEGATVPNFAVGYSYCNETLFLTFKTIQTTCLKTSAVRGFLCRNISWKQPHPLYCLCLSDFSSQVQKVLNLLRLCLHKQTFRNFLFFSLCILTKFVWLSVSIWKSQKYQFCQLPKHLRIWHNNWGGKNLLQHPSGSSTSLKSSEKSYNLFWEQFTW